MQVFTWCREYDVVMRSHGRYRPTPGYQEDTETGDHSHTWHLAPVARRCMVCRSETRDQAWSPPRTGHTGHDPAPDHTHLSPSSPGESRLDIDIICINQWSYYRVAKFKPTATCKTKWWNFELLAESLDWYPGKIIAVNTGHWPDQQDMLRILHSDTWYIVSHHWWPGDPGDTDHIPLLPRTWSVSSPAHTHTLLRWSWWPGFLVHTGDTRARHWSRHHGHHTQNWAGKVSG